ncbi:MAG: phage N-6-adenine-methyltransferase [Chloroflexota bacterium]|nr:phage N-6-adenine-methyltransferase [Chloroflexota bacterium]
MQQQSWYGLSRTPEWYTEAHVIERVIRVMGAIDLDPCSNPPPYNVPATLHMSRTDGGLNQRWHGTVFMNPPYGRVLPVWMKKLAHERAEGRVTEAITLTPARPDTRWFEVLWDADALCFWRGRLQFAGASSGAPFPSVVGYFGKHAARFATVFGDVGKVIYPRVGKG